MTLSDGDYRVWLITGASSGLGRALAEAALGAGDRVIATARDPQRLDELTGRYRGQAIAARLDVTDADEARAAVDDGLAAFGRLDIVVNNAGYGLFGALEELPADELRREFETNVFGALNVTRAALHQLRRQRSGHIVQISSLEGITPIAAGEAAYAATKFAVEGLAEALAKEIAHLGIKVTIVEPGRFAPTSPRARSPRRLTAATTPTASARPWSGSRDCLDASPTTRPGSQPPSSRRSPPRNLRSAWPWAQRRWRPSAKSSAVSGGTWMPGNASAPLRPWRYDDDAR
jgi:NAD(P)-dependent dehydrogenase (short-subunit alcohol dehydrogenase family)